MVKEFFHLIRTYLITSRYIKTNELTFIWSLMFFVILIYIAFCFFSFL